MSDIIPFEESLVDGRPVYSLRIGKKVPNNAVNLAYVYTPPISPNKNLLIEDYSNMIPENTSSGEELNFTARPDSNFLLGNIELSTDNIEITDEFSIITSVDQTPVPLYYRYILSGTFDVTTANGLFNYDTGYVNVPTFDVIRDQGNIDKTRPMVYFGNRIGIVDKNGVPLESPTYKYKVVLFPLEDGDDGECQVVIYTNFRNTDSETWYVVYGKYGERMLSEKEILNATPFFVNVPLPAIQTLAADPRPLGEWHQGLSEKIYSVEYLEDSNTYRFYAPSQIIIADHVSRPAQTFKFQIEANLNVSYNIDNPTTFNIGMYYNNTYNDPALDDTRTSMFDIVNMLPSYITAVNPNPPLGHNHPNDYMYWDVDLSQPGDVLKKYDMIIISGYGQLDLTYCGQNLINYINNGGRVWIDNCSNGEVALNIINWPAGSPTTINFSVDPQDVSSGTKVASIDINSPYLSRYYSLPFTSENAIDLGYIVPADTQTTETPGVIGAKIDIPELENWTDIVRWTNIANDAAVTFRKIGRGMLIVSNCGVTRAINAKFMVNIIIATLEEIWIKTPKIVDQVLHRDNLFPEEHINDMTNSVRYAERYMSSDSNTLIGMKYVGGYKTIREFMLPYLPQKYHSAIGDYTVTVYNMNDGINENVIMNSPSDGNQLLCAFTLVPSNVDFDLSNSGLSLADITTFYPKLRFKWSITSYTYEWDNVSQYQYVEGQTYTGDDYISATDGQIKLADLVSVLPSTLHGAAWADPNRIFYKLWLGEVQNGIQANPQLPINLSFFNTKTGEYVYDPNGENRLRWSYLFTENNLDDIIIVAKTDYYALRISKRTFSVKNRRDDSIYIANTASEDERDCWFIRVHNGKFSRDYYAEGAIVPEKCVYKIPEFMRQNFDPGVPWMKVNDDKLMYINGRTFSLNHRNIRVDTLSVVRRKYSNGIVYQEPLTRDLEADSSGHTFSGVNQYWMSSPAPKIYFMKEDGSINLMPLGAYSTNHTTGSITTIPYVYQPLFATYRYYKEEPVDIAGIDFRNGIINTVNEFQYGDNIYADYYYEEDFYTYKGYWDGTTFWNLDLNPSEGHVVKYPIVENGVTVPRLCPSSELVNKSVYIYLVPYTVDNVVQTNWTVRHTFSLESLNTIMQVNPRVIHLATIQIRENATIDDVVVMDSRIAGGGLKKHINTKKIEETQLLSSHYWDIGPWDGIAYQSNGVIVVRVPKSVISPPMTDVQVEEIIKKFMPLGVFPIIEYY